MPPPGSQPQYLEPLLGIVFDLDGTLVLSPPRLRKDAREVIRLAERYGVTPGHLSVPQPIHRIVEAAARGAAERRAPDGVYSVSKRSTRSGSTRSKSKRSRGRSRGPARRSF